MNEQNNFTLFINRFYRKIDYKIGCNLLHLPFQSSYTDLTDLVTEMLRAEITAFNSSAMANVRTLFNNDSDFDKFKLNFGRFPQVPIFVLSHLAAYIIFSNRNLRNRFEIKYENSKIPMSIYDIYLHVRETSRPGLDIRLENYSFAVQNDELGIQAHILQGTILDPFKIDNNIPLQNKLFTMISGASWSHAYDQRLVDFKRVSTVTPHVTINGLSLNEVDDLIVLSHYHFHTIRTNGGEFDPTIKESCHFIFGGFTLHSTDDHIISNNITNFSNFIINLDRSNYWVNFIQFFTVLPSGYSNPGYNKLKGNNSKIKVTRERENLPSNDVSETTSIAAVTGLKDLGVQDILTIYTLANNLASSNRNWFNAFVRLNKLYNVRIACMSKRHLGSLLLSVS